MSISFNPSLSAMNAAGMAFNATAHNVANISTDNFQPLQSTFVEGQASQNDKGVQSSSVEAVIRQPVLLNFQEGPSQTEMAREAVNMINQENMYSVNAKVITSQDEMLGNLLDNKI